MNIQIIPAIDIIDGQCIRLRQGDFNQKTKYGLNPVEVALKFEDLGYKQLHVVDLDAAKGDGKKNLSTVEKIASSTTLKIDVGGGIKSTNHIKELFGIGIAAVNIGSTAIKDPELFTQWLSKFGNDKIWLSADVRNTKIAINGWQNDTDFDLFDILNQFENNGLQTAVITSIERDGTMQGPNLKLYEQIIDQFPNLSIVASGGVSSPCDLTQLESIGINQVIIGKALYESNAFKAQKNE